MGVDEPRNDKGTAEVQSAGSWWDEDVFGGPDSGDAAISDYDRDIPNRWAICSVDQDAVEKSNRLATCSDWFRSASRQAECDGK